MSKTNNEIDVLQDCLRLLKKVDDDLRRTNKKADEALANLEAFSERSKAFWEEYRKLQLRG